MDSTRHEPGGARATIPRLTIKLKLRSSLVVVGGTGHRRLETWAEIRDDNARGSERAREMHVLRKGRHCPRTGTDETQSRYDMHPSSPMTKVTRWARQKNSKSIR
ncbi:hypothetical protein L227DRAFT_98119 [Lentinus tigrinus ALCF2SS1-6]|uniref:Uncharacterized protein n=1 Tax=Lentinus tigrinus ALCF2SS1-6 TaxID=1328759 RepID=A0A5C2S9B9_9APHY|nr:hypothetical protein L227DRAFT_98119 [Lentinus tigrinus ALCF2SS1-6]